MSPPNPLKPIQEALERVLHESGLTDFGRSVSSIDDLTAEVQHVYERVDDIEQLLETIVPILERLTVVFEDIQSDLQPMSELASKIPGSGSRRRRREKEGRRIEARSGGPGPSAQGPRDPDGAPPADRPQGAGSTAPHDSHQPPSDRSDAPGRGSPSSADGPAAAGGSGSRSSAPSSADGPPAAGGSVRPGATGYSPVGERRDDR